NGDPDTASNTASKHIELDFNRNVSDHTFAATDQSIWGSGQSVGFQKTDFFGPNETFGPDPEVTLPVPIPGTPLFVNATADVDGHFKFGFNYDIDINGGQIDAQAPLEITLDSAYNRTTDVLQLTGKDASLPGLSFQAQGPGGHFFL